MQVTPREPVREELDVLILGAGFGGAMAGYHPVQPGVPDLRNPAPVLEGRDPPTPLVD